MDTKPTQAGPTAQGELQPEPKESAPPPGFLILRMKDGEGAVVSDTSGDIEVRLCNARQGRADVAIRAPKNKRIRKIE